MVGNTGTSASGSFAPVGMIAAPLLAHVAQAVLGAALLALVEHDEIGEVEHVDLLELARGAVLARHHVQRQIDEIDDLGVGLADAGGLDDDRDRIRRPDTARSRPSAPREVARCCAARGQRAHEDRLGGEAVHADAIARAARRRCGGGSDPSRPRRSARSGKCRTRRASSSSVRLDLPAPPVPVMPMTGALWRARASARRICSAWPLRRPRALEHRDGAGDLAVVAGVQRPELVGRLATAAARARIRRRSCRSRPSRRPSSGV